MSERRSGPGSARNDRARRLRPAALLLAAVTVLGACGGSGDGEDDTAATSTGAASSLPAATAEPTVVEGSGDVAAAVEEYRNLLGPDNGGEPTQNSSGRREINWDGVPDELAAPNALPSDFFNAETAPRARGAVLSTPGEHVSVSADSDNPTGTPVRFGNINPSYPDEFQVFSEERLFSPIGSNVVDLRFFVPGTDTPAVSRGFGAVYTDVDSADAADFEFFDANDTLLGTFRVPLSEESLSFLGVAFPEPVVARVRIVYGNAALGPDDSPDNDVAVMDDFIFGEPQPR